MGRQLSQPGSPVPPELDRVSVRATHAELSGRARLPAPSRPISRTQLLVAMCLMAAAGLVGGCSTSALPTLRYVAELSGHQSSETRCHQLFANIEQAVAAAGVRDVEARVVPGFPNLRVNRFLAHFSTDFEGRAYGPAFEAWVDRLQNLSTEAINIEIANLSDREFAGLSRETLGYAGDRQSMSERVRKCAKQVRLKQLAVSAQRRMLVARAKVPDSYDDKARLLGAFPLTSIPIENGWRTWKRENLGSFDLEPAALPVAGELIDYYPGGQNKALPAKTTRLLLARSRDTHLQIPEPDGPDLQRLLRAFAPIWQIDVAGNYDRFGQPVWSSDGAAISIDQERPVVFTHVSHTQIGGQFLLQLNYAIWFQARPPVGAFDLLSGNLDAVIWRVTLGPDGRPLVYDSIHACGCYHLVFPLPAVQSRLTAPVAEAMRERPAIIRRAPVVKPGERVVLRIATASHYLVGVYVREVPSDRKPRRTYRILNDRALRSLPIPRAGRRSLYGEDGIVAGTERLERYLLWPSGVLSPGAMRQWGHHAIALTERRHFDEPDLFENVLGGPIEN